MKTMDALGAIVVACLFIASTLYIGGYQVYAWGYKWGAISAWVIAGIILILGILATIRFIKSYKLQKRIEDLKTNPPLGAF